MFRLNKFKSKKFRTDKPSMRFIGGFFILFLWSQLSPAEYRVFKLIISKKALAGAPPPAPGSEKIVMSTLDPEQYPRIYSLGIDEQISYTETWRCYGRTSGFAPFCPNPKDQIPPQKP